MKPIDSRALWILLTNVLIILVTQIKNSVNKVSQESQIKRIFWRCNGCWNIVWCSWFLENIPAPDDGGFFALYSMIFSCIIRSIKRNVKVAIFIWFTLTATNITAWFLWVRGGRTVQNPHYCLCIKNCLTKKNYHCSHNYQPK